MRHRHRSVSLPAMLLAVASALAACGGADEQTGVIVTGPVHHMETALARAGADLGPSAIAYVQARAVELSLDLSTDDDFEIASHTTAAGLRHVRLQQTHRGVPVASSIVIAHADDATFLGFNGYLTRNLDGFDVAPDLTGEEAMAAAEADHAGRPVRAAPRSSTLVILPGRGGTGARLAWRVSLHRWWYYIDARDGSVLRRYDNAQTAVLQASGPGGNPARGRSWEGELDVEEDDGAFAMETDRLKTMDARDDDEVVKGMDLQNMPDPVANDAHGHAEVVLSMMRTWMGRDSLDDDGYRIESRVHDDDVCDLGPDNACWDGEKVNYGIGAAQDGTYDWGGALDLVGHEMNHGFTEFHSGLEYEGESGGLNESFSDIAGTIAEFYQEGDDADFDIFEDITEYGGIRFMCEPRRDGVSVDDARDLHDDIDVHNSSGIGNRAFCLAVGRYKASVNAGTTSAVQNVGQVWYTANAAYWTSGTGFSEACRGTVDAARALGMPSDVVEAIGQSWADVGAACETSAAVCDLDGECDGGEGETCASCPDDCGGCDDGCSFWQLYQCEIGLDDCSQCGGESGCGDNICAGDETDQSCAADCGCAALECGDLAPYGCYCDDSCGDFGDCCADRDDACG